MARSPAWPARPPSTSNSEFTAVHHLIPKVGMPKKVTALLPFAVTFCCYLLLLPFAVFCSCDGDAVTSRRPTTATAAMETLDKERAALGRIARRMLEIEVAKQRQNPAWPALADLLRQMKRLQPGRRCSGRTARRCRVCRCESSKS